MKKIIFFVFAQLLFFFSPLVLASAPTIPTDYTALLNALKQGDTIRAILVINKCNPSLPEYQSSDEILWSLDFTNFFKSKFPHQGQLTEGIAAAYNKLKQTESGLVYDYARLRIFADGTVEGLSEFIDPINFTSIRKITYHCKLDKQIVTFYDIT